MSPANHIFLPWVQPGASANIPDAYVERLSGEQPASVAVAVGIGVNSSVIEKSVRLYGPGEVTGIDPQQVVRLEPRPRTTDFEPNYFPFIEFDRPDFPWLFSPAKADAQGRLRPWLVLVVVRKQGGVELRPADHAPLPVLEIRPPARPGAELPDLAESHFWAHAQTTGAARTDLRAALQSEPARTISRLMCARRLKPSTEYLACVVPAYDVGRAAGLGQPPTDATLRPSWSSGEHAPPDIVLPVYCSWEFRTSAGGDFEELVRRLQPRELPPDVGKRRMDISHPGFAIQPQPETGAPGTIIGLEGALRVVNTEPDQWPAQTRVPFQTALAAIVNTPWKMASADAGGDPIVAPPIYGEWHAGVHLVAPDGDPASPDPWLNALNLDPRHRAAAAMGTEVVQAEQEALMASAWEQLGEAAIINQRLRQGQLSRAVNERYHAKAFSRFKPDAFMRVVAPAQSRFTIAEVQTGQAPMLFAQRLARSFVPPTAVSAGVRKLSRPRGAFNRQYARAGDAGPQTLVSFFNKPGLTGAFSMPPGIRGQVDVNGVSDGVTAMIGDGGFIWVLDPAPHWERMPVGFTEMLELLRFIRLTPGGMGAGSPASVPAGFAEAAQVHQQYLEQLFAEPPAIDNRTALESEVTASALASLRPAATLRQAIMSGIQMQSPATRTGDDLEPVMDAPTFPQPMYAALRDRSPEYLFPGLAQVPPDTVQLLQTNSSFIESFMVGLNSEMGRELLWRGYPTDQRGTYFQQFWDTSSAGLGEGSDIPPIHHWGNRALGSNALDANSDHLVLLLRGELLRRYPGVVIYAVKAVRRDGRRVLATDSPAGVTPPLESHPLFRGTLDADVTFVGFDMTREQALADDGWFFMLQQQPAEPRFGLDDDPFDTGESGIAPPLKTWNDLNWAHLADSAEALDRLSHLPVVSQTLRPAQPVPGTWGRNAAHMAFITKQLPVRVAIHASELLP
jgi:hypothetical protein